MFVWSLIFLNLRYLFIYLCQSEAHGVPKMSENNLQESVFSFYPVDPRDAS